MASGVRLLGVRLLGVCVPGVRIPGTNTGGVCVLAASIWLVVEEKLGEEKGDMYREWLGLGPVAVPGISIWRVSGVGVTPLRCRSIVERLMAGGGRGGKGSGAVVRFGRSSFPVPPVVSAVSTRGPGPSRRMESSRDPSQNDPVRKEKFCDVLKLC